MNAITDFEHRHGKEALEFYLQRAGIHAGSVNSVPSDESQRLYYSLIEALGYSCWSYEDAKFITEEQAKAFLKAHAKDIKTEAIADYISLEAGIYNSCVGQSRCSD